MPGSVGCQPEIAHLEEMYPTCVPKCSLDTNAFPSLRLDLARHFGTLSSTPLVPLGETVCVELSSGACFLEQQTFSPGGWQTCFSQNLRCNVASRMQNMQNDKKRIKEKQKQTKTKQRTNHRFCTEITQLPSVALPRPLPSRSTTLHDPSTTPPRPLPSRSPLHDSPLQKKLKIITFHLILTQNTTIAYFTVLETNLHEPHFFGHTTTHWQTHNSSMPVVSLDTAQSTHKAASTSKAL